MTKIIMKGFSVITQKVFDYLSENDGYDLIAFTDNDTNKWGMQYRDVPCISPFELKRRYDKGEFDYVVVNTIWDVKRGYDVFRELQELGIEGDRIRYLTIEFCNGDSQELKLKTFYELNYLFYLEFHLTNKCNLNCAGCSHFVPLIPKDDDISFEDLLKDLSQLKTKVDNFNEIRIMGGEPLLCENLLKCIHYTRMLYPYSHIFVVTNGSLLLRMGDDFWNCLKDNDICLDISCYPPFYDRYDDIIGVVKEKGIMYRFGAVKWGMRQCLKKRSFFPIDDVFDKCYCVNLYKGKLYTCPEQAYVDYYNRFFNMNMPINKGIDIYSDISFEEIRRKLYLPGELCEYCNKWFFDIHDYRKFEVCGEKPNMSSWYVE